LLRGGSDVHRIGIRHGLDDYGRAAADLNLADFYTYGFLALLCHISTIVANLRLGWVAQWVTGSQLRAQVESRKDSRS
jgi:hypothetical protein